MKNACTTRLFCHVLSVMLIFEPAVLLAQDDEMAAAQANAAAAAAASCDSATAEALSNAAAASALMSNDPASAALLNAAAANAASGNADAAAALDNAAAASASSVSSSLSLPAAPTLQLDTAPTAPSAPIPVQIRTAKKIFIANAGDKTDLFPDIFSGGPERPYVQFYSAMEKWGHYQIASTPETADLIFEVGIASPSAAEIAPTSGDLGPWNGAELHDVQLQVKILDPNSHISLWQMDSHVQNSLGMNLKKTRDKEFDTAMNNLVMEIQQLSQQEVTTADSSVLTQEGHGRGIRASVIAGIVGFVAFATIGIVMVANRPGMPPMPTLPTQPNQPYQPPFPAFP